MNVPQKPSNAGKATTDSAVDEAEKKVGAVLETLEQETGADVEDIGLDDMVDTEPGTGKPVVKKAVDIEVRERHKRGWLR